MSETMVVVCPGCKRKNSKAPAAFLGRKVKCKGCGCLFLLETGKTAFLKESADAPRAFAAIPRPGDVKEWVPGDLVLNIYEVAGVLGKGGMGKVFRVHHRTWNMDLAVKSPLAKWFRHKGAVENFTREAETWVGLGLHPHIVSCYYVRVVEGIPRIFAEYVEGGSLADLIRKGDELYRRDREEPLARILDIAIQFAWGLDYAHEKGMIHQDVKPANVMMAKDGTAKVTDFGLAKAKALTGEESAADDGWTLMATCGGMTPAYCSPEQSGKQSLTRRTDIWSWAVSVLEMFTGEILWQSGVVAGASFDAYLETGDEIFRARMPGSLGRLLRECFSENPDDRPKTMGKVAERLLEIYKAETGGPYPRSVPEAADLRVESLNNQAVSLFDLGKPEQAEDIWTRALALEPGHTDTAFNRCLCLWRSARIDDQTLLKAWKETVQWERKDWKGARLTALIHAERGDWQAVSDLLRSAPEAEKREELRELFRMAGERIKNPVRFPAPVDIHAGPGNIVCEGFLVDVSHDGKMLVTGAVHYHVAEKKRKLRIDLWEADTGKPIRRLYVWEAAKFYRLIQLKFSRDDKCVAIYTKWFQLLDVGTGDVVFCHGKWNDQETVQAADCTRDLTRLVVADYGGIAFFDLEKGDAIGKRLPLSGEKNLRIAETGNFFQVSTMHRVYGFSTREMDPKQPLFEYRFEGSGPPAKIDLSVDGRYLLHSGEREKALVVKQIGSSDTFSTLTTGDLVKSFDKNHYYAIGNARFSPDARHVAATTWSSEEGNQVRIWETATGRCRRTFPGGKDKILTFCFHPDGTRLYTVVEKQDRPVVAWDISGLADPFEAPLTISRRVTAAHVDAAKNQYQDHLRRGLDFIVAGDHSAAEAALTAARNQAGYAKAPEAMDAWLRLYPFLSRKTLRGCWEKYHLPDNARERLEISPNAKHPIVNYWIAAVLPDGGHCIHLLDEMKSGRRIMELCETATGKAVRAFTGHEAYRGSVAPPMLSSDGNFGVSNAFRKSEFGTTLNDYLLWDIAQCRCAEIEQVPGSVHLWTPDRKKLVGTIRIRLGMSPTSGFRSEIFLWDLKKKEVVSRLPAGHEEEIVWMKRHPDGKRFLSACNGGRIKLRSLSDGSEIRAFSGHRDRINSLNISPDGKSLLSTGYDRQLKLWELETGRCLHTFAATSERAWHSSKAKFSPDGRRIFLLAADALTVWDAESHAGLFSLEIPGATNFWITPDEGYLVTKLGVWYLDWELARTKFRAGGRN